VKMIRIRIIYAIFCKQVKDILKNTQVLILFAIFPVIAYVMTSSMKMETAFFVSLFGTMHAVFTPLMASASIIAEEKEKNTLRILILSNVTPFEYLLSIGSFVFILTNISSFLFAWIGGFRGRDFFGFVLVMMLGSICSIILGAALAIFSKNQMSATASAIPLAMVFSFLPMLSAFNDSVGSISRFTFGQQISNLLKSPQMSTFTAEPFLIILVNFLVIGSLFVFAFRKKGLDD